MPLSKGENSTNCPEGGGYDSFHEKSTLGLKKLKYSFLVIISFLDNVLEQVDERYF